MFNLMPFSTTEPDVFDYLTALGRSAHSSRVPEYAQFPADIYQKGNDYILSAELPGFSKEEITIDLKNDVLTITASHEKKDAAKESEKEEPSVTYLHRERLHRNFKRSFSIEGIDTDQIKAAYNNGILDLTLPKEAPKKPDCITINVD